MFYPVYKVTPGWFKRLQSSLAVLATLQVYSFPAVAYDPYPTENDFFTEIPQVYSASRLIQNKLTAPASVTIIDRQMIEASGAIEIPELLRLVPGMQVAQANGNIYAVTYHGLSKEWSNQMQVLVDGRSVYTTLFNIVDWNSLSIDINDIDRIEVIRGSNAPTYGENAFRGSINIITRQPYEDPGLTVDVTGGYANTRRTYLRYAGTSSDIDYKFAAGSKSDDGYKSIADDDKDINYFNTRWIVTPGIRDSVDFQAGYSDGKVGAWGQTDIKPVTYDVVANYGFPYRDKTDKSYYLYGNWTHKFDNSSLLLAVNRNRLEWNDAFQVDLTPYYPGEIVSLGQFIGEAERTHVELQHNIDFTGNLRLSWGGSLREDKLKDPIILDKSGYETEYSDRIFANTEYTFKRDWIFNAGAMYEHNTMVGSYISPRIGVNYLLSEDKAIRASVTRSRRSPSIFEYYIHEVARRPTTNEVIYTFYTSDPDLKGETMTDYEIGFVDDIRDWKTNIDFKVFREKMNGIINDVANMAGTERVFMNTGDVVVDGAELQLSFHPEPLTSINFQYSYETLTGSLLRQINPTKTIDEFRLDRIAERGGSGGLLSDYVPRDTVSMQIAHDFHGLFSASLEYYHVSHMTWGSEGDILDGYDRADARLNKKMNIGDSSLLVSAIFQNFGGDYHEFSDQTIYDNRFYLNAELRH